MSTSDKSESTRHSSRRFRSSPATRANPPGQCRAATSESSHCRFPPPPQHHTRSHWPAWSRRESRPSPQASGVWQDAARWHRRCAFALAQDPRLRSSLPQSLRTDDEGNGDRGPSKIAGEELVGRRRWSTWAKSNTDNRGAQVTGQVQQGAQSTTNAQKG